MRIVWRNIKVRRAKCLSSWYVRMIRSRRCSRFRLASARVIHPKAYKDDQQATHHTLARNVDGRTHH